MLNRAPKALYGYNAFIQLPPVMTNLGELDDLIREIKEYLMHVQIRKDLSAFLPSVTCRN